MRKVLLILFALSTTLLSNGGIISIPVYASDNAKSGTQSVNDVFAALDVNAFLKLTPSQVETITGKKMNFFQKVSLRQTQKKVKKNPDFLKKVNYSFFSGKDDRKFHWSAWLAFAFGLATLLLLFFSIPAIVFGIIGLTKTGPNKEYKGLGLSITGIALGFIGVLLWVIVAAALLAGF
jgi:hypothetical protein